MAICSHPRNSCAAVFHAAGQPLTLEQFPIPALKGSEVLVRIRCATICGSDLHSYYGRRPSPAPGVLGHEMVGEVAGLGPAGGRDFAGNPLELGDRVTWSMVWSCGECFYCRNGLPSKCERLMKFGHEAIIPGRALIGGMAQHCHLPEKTAIFKVPANVPDLVASPANCATSTVAAVLRNAGPVRGRTVVVLGAGMLGQTACAMAAAAGAAQVVVFEPDAGRRANALGFGATAAMDAAAPEEDTQARVRQLSAGRGADIALEFSGHAQAIERGVELLRTGGSLVMAGATFTERPARLSGEQIVRRMLRIIGVYNYAPDDLGRALEFLSQNLDKYPFEKLVGRTFPLAQVNAAFEHAERQRPPRVAIIP
ncbi:MAG: zinc-binding dehydrogenase [Limisphaerales bacterium]